MASTSGRWRYQNASSITCSQGTALDPVVSHRYRGARRSRAHPQTARGGVVARLYRMWESSRAPHSWMSPP